MPFSLLLCLFASLVLSPRAASTTLRPLVRQMTQTIGATNNQLQPGCKDAIQTVAATTGFPTSIIEGAYSQKLKLSVLTPEQAQEVYCTVVFKVDQKLRNDGVCHERVLLNALQLKVLGITSGKVFATRPIFAALSSLITRGPEHINPQVQGLETHPFNWQDHGANLILIQTTNGPRKYVIDPFLFPDGPAPLEEWYQKLTARKDSIDVSLQIANAYAYTTDNIDNSRTNFVQSELTKARSTMKVAHSTRKKFGWSLLPPDKVPRPTPGRCP